MWLAVEVSEGQLAEELIAGKQKGNTQIRQRTTKQKKRLTRDLLLKKNLSMKQVEVV